MAGLIVTFTAVGVLFAALAVPLIRRKVPPNGWYGLRVDATFADEWVWYEANARSGRDLFVLGTSQFLIAVLLALVNVPEMAYAVTNIASLIVGTVTFGMVGIRRANRLVAQRQPIDPAA
jgi:uncharacterized membrane protein